MGIHDNGRIEAKDKARGKAQRKTPWGRALPAGDAATWAAIDPALLARTISAVCAAGASIQLNRTRDGGSLGVRVYDDELDVKTEWGRPGEGLEDLLASIQGYYAERAKE